MFSVCSHPGRSTPARFPVLSPNSGPRSFRGVGGIPHYLVPCPFQGYPSLWSHVSSGGGVTPVLVGRYPSPGQGVPQSWLGAVRLVRFPAGELSWFLCFRKHKICLKLYTFFMQSMGNNDSLTSYTGHFNTCLPVVYVYHAGVLVGQNQYSIFHFPKLTKGLWFCDI